MTRRDILTLFHEPFGDPFYYGPEKISAAWQLWPADKIAKSGKAHYTYDHVLRTLLDATEKPDGKRVFLKDIAYHIIPPIHSPNATPQSLRYLFSNNEPPNPTLLPASIIRNFRFVFLIRNPSSSIPSLYRCFVPPLVSSTEQHVLDPMELGYRELRLLFDYLYPPASRPSEAMQRTSPDQMPLLIDAEDLLANPYAILRSLCSSLSFPYSPSMLSWSSPEDHAFAFSLFEKYAGYHEDALNSTGLHPKPIDPDSKSRTKSKEEENQEWAARFGREAAKTISDAVNLCQEDYEYLRQFRMRVG
ncbi:MAG: hypothetical protein Q9220_006904 [cf. Caloplaca sp. 1 TL-2023]